MIINYFLSHQWKKSKRSSIWQKNLVVNIIMGFFFILLFAEIVIASFYISYEWHEIVKTGDPITAFHQVIAWYFAGMFALRFFLQSLPVMEIRPYQHLPIKKNSLIHFILARGGFNLFTLAGIFFLIPFSIFQINYYYDGYVAFLWFLGIFSLDLSLNYLIFFIKKKMVANLKTVTYIVLIIGILAAGDYFGWYSYSEFFAKILDAIPLNPVLFTIPIILLTGVYFLNYRFLKSAMYVEDLVPERSGNLLNSGRLNYLQKFGQVGELITLDIRLNLRNKRTRSMLYMAPLFLGYGLFFYPSDEYTKDGGFMIFVGMFISGVIMINYLQYAFAYEGGFFDYLLSKNVNFTDYVRAKLQLASVIVVTSFIISIPYIYFGTEVFFINLACFLFNLGIVAPMILYFASFNKKTMVLSKGTAFNYQGIGATHFFILIPVFIIPLLIYMPFKWAGNPELGLITLGGISLIALAFKKYFILMIVNNLKQRKYIMAEGFRDRS
ncbi:MAG: hypothetical protein CVT92_13460 [Bacteroidetes bacterium HGW-Bacteroidetes-1]|jgi:hypothetical protein|nr:MAG: hypothetical protein CVT92_13460 [Bacteroidetes bacterium HGW-Bacteroidetes-1]